MGKNSEKTQPIIVKKKKGGHPHHGGAWKIAYADFVTAMMAFFLLMWLLGSTTKGELMGIAEYFQTPLQVALFGGTGAGDASSLIKGGGQDLTRSTGQVKRGDMTEQKKVVNIRAARAELDLPTRVDAPADKAEVSGPLRGDPIGSEARAAAQKADAEALKALKTKIETMIDTLPNLTAFKKQLLLDFTDEGLRIQIIDDQNRPMFDLSSAQLKPYAIEILNDIGVALNSVPNNITITGHTDATPYRGSSRAGMSNWELSADRANAARREMVRAGMEESKVIRVIGNGSSALFKPESPLDPVNRRISIIVLKKTFEMPLSEGALGSAPALGLPMEPPKETLKPAQAAPPPTPATDSARKP